MVEPDDEPLNEEDRRAVAASREYFRQNPEGGITVEQAAADLGFTMDQIRGSRGEPDQSNLRFDVSLDELERTGIYRAMDKKQKHLEMILRIVDRLSTNSLRRPRFC
jgi:hypothetical protein